MKTTLRKISIHNPNTTPSLQRLITQDLHQCTTPKLSTICNASGKVCLIFWVQHHNQQTDIWIEQTNIPELLKTIQFYDPFQELTLQQSDQTIWADTQLQFSNTPIPGDDSWPLFLIQQTIPTITADIKGRYTPQILNLIDAVSFHKGCFIGYEVIARTQFRGSSKRIIQYQTHQSPISSAINCHFDGTTYHTLTIEKI
ncbi:folate-binding protein YgfZ [Candidatus Synchoanobacter obligatus]|uniref:Aminomethyltransferase folate-binding domain-containing protein n=1 Tax=Candidatus Synchoanobacter obligatus TaxID=2919597 RepID=A0ABT1L5G7_9GAMM|nr:folate-binding protein YgfZ [Candidatus Synchoanobacter obligatus]MCP8352424.1 hypothetical protein [Candidatus Synchoanobacter obligatus]